MDWPFDKTSPMQFVIPQARASHLHCIESHRIAIFIASHRIALAVSFHRMATPRIFMLGLHHLPPAVGLGLPHPSLGAQGGPGVQGYLGSCFRSSLSRPWNQFCIFCTGSSTIRARRPSCTVRTTAINFVIISRQLCRIGLHCDIVRHLSET